MTSFWLTLRRAWRPIRQWEWRHWLLAALLYVGGYGVWLIAGPASLRSRDIVGHLARLLPCALIGWAAMPRAPMRWAAAWRFISLGGWAWFAAHFIAALYPLASGQRAPLPSLADIALLSGYVFVAEGVLQYPLPAHGSVGRTRVLFDMALTSGASLALCWLVLLRPLVSLTGSAHPAEIFWAVIYPLADLTLLLIWLNAWLISGEGRLRSALSFIALALAALAMAHIAAAYGILRGLADAGNPLEVSELLGLCLLALGALHQREFGVDARAPSETSVRRHLWPRIQALLPLATVLGLGWYTVLDWRLTGGLDVIGLWATLLLGLAVVARQGMVAGEVELWQYAQLVQSVADPAFICGADGRLQLVNPAALVATGYEQESELLGQPFTKLLNWEQWNPDLQRERLFAEGWSGEAFLRRREGGRVPVFLSFRPVRHTASARPALAGIVHDLTQVKQQEAVLRAAYDEVAVARRELQALNAHLEQKVEEKTRGLSEANAQLAEQNAALQTLDQLKSDFVSLVSHELRAPLTTVSGGIELLLSEPNELSPRARESLALVQTHLQRLAHFVSTILDLSALEAGRLPLTPEPMALAAVLTSIHSQLSLGPAPDRLLTTVSADLPLMMADPQAVTSVIFHLVDNALKYAPDSDVRVEADVDDARVRVWVSDHGPGLPPEWREKIFEKFERIDQADARAVYGHGLGLYMCRKLVQMMGGEIVAGETPGGGARFTFWLPVAEDEHDA
jgi:PAS domain S-box-containing protein